MTVESGTPGVGNISDVQLLHSLIKATRSSFSRALNMPVEIRHSNTVESRIRLQGTEAVAYPRAYVKFSTYSDAQRLNNLTVNRRGFTAWRVNEDSTTKWNARVYPITASAEFHFLTDSAPTASKFTSDMITLRASKSLAFEVVVAQVFQYMSKIEVDPALSSEEADFTSEEKKGLIDIAVPFTVDGWIGRIDQTVVNLKNTLALKAATQTYGGQAKPSLLSEFNSYFEEP